MVKIMKNKLLEIKNLSVSYSPKSKALNNFSLIIREGESIGIVGETGAGKTTLAHTIMGLLPNEKIEIISGNIEFEERDLLNISDKEFQKIRGKKIAIILENSLSSLNPMLSVLEQVAEMFQIHERLSKHESRKKAIEILKQVKLPIERANNYPHEFSGGMKQRVMIAISLALAPKVVIADEPTSALDVTVQKEILELMKDFKNTTNSSLLLLTHNPSIVNNVCDKVAIVYLGEIIEIGTTYEVLNTPKHPYTEELIKMIPDIHKNYKRLYSISEKRIDKNTYKTGCKFVSNCKYAEGICSKISPEMKNISETHNVRCLLVDKIFKKG